MPGDVRITGDDIVFLTASEDAEATKECCADTLPLLSPEECCDVTRAISVSCITPSPGLGRWELL